MHRVIPEATDRRELVEFRHGGSCSAPEPRRPPLMAKVRPAVVLARRCALACFAASGMLLAGSACGSTSRSVRAPSPPAPPAPPASPAPPPAPPPPASVPVPSSSPQSRSMLLSAPCSREALPPKPGGGRWVCTFDDEFDASTGDANALHTSWWTPEITATSDAFTTGPPGHYVCYVNSPQNISVSGGALHLTVRKATSQPFTCGPYQTQYTGGMVTTHYGFHQTYGRFEIRALLPQATVAGLDEALWMWPLNDKLYGSWPGSGEIDISETWSQAQTEAVPWIHYNFDPSNVNPSIHTNTYHSACQISPSERNVYAMTWSPGNITVTINGKACLVDNYVPSGELRSPEPFNQPFFILLTQGLDRGAFNPLTAPLPATLSVDYVRAWR